MALSIVIDGKITGAKDALAQIKTEVKNAAAQINTLGNTGPIDKLNESLASTAKLARQVRNTPIDPTVSRKFTDEIIRGNRALKDMAEPAGTARRNIEGIGDSAKPAMDKVRKGASGAASALGDVSRIAGDLPFGLLGISNNLTPMIESFGRLKTETGSTKAALSAMASSLIGPAGLALGINIVTSAFLIYQNGISGFNKKTKEAKDQAEDFIKTLRTVNQVAAEGSASEEGNISKVQALSKAVLDQSNSYEVRNRALNELKGINKEYFGDLTLEASKLSLLTSRVDEYTNAIKAQAVLKGFTDEIGRVSVEIAKQENNLKKLATVRDQTAAKLARTQRYTVSGGQEVESRAYKNAEIAAREANQTFLDQRNIVETLSTNYAELNGQIDAATKRLLQFKSTDDNTGRTDKTDPLKKQLEYYERILNTITDVNEKVAVGEKVLDLRVRLLMRDGPGQGLTAQELEATVRGFRDDFQKLLEEQAATLEFSPTLRTSQILKVEIPENVSFFLTNKGTITSKLNNEVSKAVGVDGKIPVITLHDARIRLLGAKTTAEIEGKEKLQQGLAEAINQAILDIKIEALTGLGEILAGALTGGLDGIRSAAKNMLSSIGSILQQLGKYVISTALKILSLKKIIEKFVIANPALAIAAGVGLVALGGVLKNITFAGPKLAEGGITTGPTIAQVGEAGRELILPLNKLPQLMGASARNSGGPTSVGLGIRGRELVAFIIEETKQYNRNL